MAMVMLQSADEILVFDAKDEKQVKKEFFAEGTGRDIQDYDRKKLGKFERAFLIQADIKVG